MKGEIWTLAEKREGVLHSMSLELLAWGRELADKRGTPLASVLLSDSVSESEIMTLIRHGADRVYLIESPELAFFLADSYASSLLELVRSYEPEVFIAGATTQGRSVMPILYAAAGTGLTADCTGLDIDPASGDLIQTRPAIGGNVMAEIVTPNHRPQMCTVRPKSRRPLEANPGRQGDVVRFSPSQASLASRLVRLAYEPESSVGLPIQEAEVIVAGGKGMKRAANFQLLSELASELGGSVGASRMAVDLGWAPFSAQVGLSGKAVTPRLYIACGISGAVQHIAGMSGAAKVVAINTDPEAPIFGASDIAIVGDVQDVLPRLIADVRAIKSGRGTK